MKPVKGVRCFDGRLYLGVSAGEKSRSQRPEQAAERPFRPSQAFHDVLELHALSVACQRRMEAQNKL